MEWELERGLKLNAIRIDRMTQADIRIRAFWEWFVDHRTEFDSLSKPEEPFWEVALEQIKKVDERFWIELSAIGDPIREFIVTAAAYLA